MIANLDFARPPAEIIARYRNVRIDAVARAIDPARIADPAIKPVHGLPHVVGPALTVATHGGDPRMAILAIGAARPGDVILIAAGGDTRSFGWGGGLTLSADAAGCEAVAIDGLAVDKAAIVACTTPVYARGVSLRSVPAETAGSIAVPVDFGGVAVAPGDLVIGDADGLCIIPAADLVDVLERAEAETARVAANVELISGSGRTIFDLRGGKEFAASLGLTWPE
jgi:4-hydroxy-4-methyl-2-oxoglutarate aldolase